MSKILHLDAPNIGKLEKKYLNNAIDEGYVSTVGPFVPKFEKRFADYLGVRRAVSTQSGTAALHMALRELGIKKGDEVIVPALTFIATVNPVTYVGATPRFADVDIDTWDIDPAEIEKNVTRKTKAIIPVHLYGNPCKMDSILAIAKKHDLCVIEDATESLGAFYKGRHVGTFGNFGCFSFNGNKVITTGGGGIIAGNDKKRLERIKFLVNQGRDESGDYCPEVGFNYRMTNLEAAVGLAQMKKVKDFLKEKKAFNDIYRKELKGSTASIRFQEEYEGAKSSWWLSCAMFEKKVNITALQKRLKGKGVPTRRVFMPLIGSSPYKIYRLSEYRNSFEIYNRALCLPSSTLNTRERIYYVCDMIKRCI